ncbi:MAG: hypothetical protein WCF68_13400 [Terriglobales bacterium]
MKLHELPLFAMSLLLLCLPLNAQTDFEGDFWKPKNQDVKLSYVFGFVDGRNHGINEAAEAIGTKIDDPRLSKLASGETVAQIVDGVDEFYKDWRNRKVLLRDAMQYVLDEANGKDDSKLLLVMRQRGSERKR